MTIRYFYYENPKDTRIVKIDLREVEALAEGVGDLRKAEAMDDESFYEYCDIVAYNQSLRG